SMTVTDSGGAHAALTFTTQKCEHGAIITDAGAGTPALANFATTLQTALNAMGARTYTVLFARGVYTITVDSGTFSVVF
ncbi:hypothetical protein, partial [Streptococcus pneumoniae]|uniref:hypothetical protein n=1 Tax=Streptococcus pneumoniae TaxID=1313 RepID=UPI0018B036DB